MGGFSLPLLWGKEGGKSRGDWGEKRRGEMEKMSFWRGTSEWNLWGWGLVRGLGVLEAFLREFKGDFGGVDVGDK